MDKNLLKNINFEEIVDFSSLVEYQKGQIVSRTLSQNKAVSITLFAFDAGEEISSHKSSGDAMVYILDGKAQVTIGNETYEPSIGKAIVMPAGMPHAVLAIEPFKMLLIVVFP